jgi:hypothetical protein
MQAQTLLVSRDGYGIESLTQKKPSGFKPSLLNMAAVGGVKALPRTSFALIG